MCWNAYFPDLFWICEDWFFAKAGANDSRQIGKREVSVSVAQNARRIHTILLNNQQQHQDHRLHLAAAAIESNAQNGFLQLQGSSCPIDALWSFRQAWWLSRVL